VPVSYDFRGRVAIVTGGARGIGRAVAQRLENAGARTFVWDIRRPEYPEAFCSHVDIANRASIEDALRRVLQEHSTIDILVNNAGIHGGITPLLESDPDKWRQIIELNLIGAYEVSRLIVPRMKESACGRVVNMASIAGKEGSPGASAYSAAKAGLIAMTKSLGKELANTNIRVNAVAPGAINTDILQQLTPDAVKGMIEKSPIKRLGTVEEVANLVMWLCSEDCSFSTGAIFDVSGGRAAY